MNNNTIKGPNVHCVNNTLREYVSTSAIAYLLIESHGPCIVWQPFVGSDFGLFFVVFFLQFFYFIFNSRMFNNVYIDFCVCIIAIAGCLLIQYSLTTTCLETYTKKTRHLYSVQRQCFFMIRVISVPRYQWSIGHVFSSLKWTIYILVAIVSKNCALQIHRKYRLVCERHIQNESFLGKMIQRQFVVVIWWSGRELQAIDCLCLFKCNVCIDCFGIITVYRLFSFVLIPKKIFTFNILKIFPIIN